MNSLISSILEMGSNRAVADMAVDAIVNNRELFRDALDLCLLDEYPASMRAARVVQLYCEKDPEAIYPCLDEITPKILSSKIDGVKRNFLKIYGEFIDIRRLSEPGPLLNACFTWLLDSREKPAVRIHAAGVIYRIADGDPDLLNELHSSIMLIIQEGPASIRAMGKQMLKRIRAENRDFIH